MPLPYPTEEERLLPPAAQAFWEQTNGLPIGSPFGLIGLQAAFLTLLTVFGVFFDLSLAANSCLTLSAMASVSTL